MGQSIYGRRPGAPGQEPRAKAAGQEPQTRSRSPPPSRYPSAHSRAPRLPAPAQVLSEESSDVQLGQRVAASGMLVKQNGHSLVVTASSLGR
jgi:hypothetical protein